jgi:hypothetical protein
MTKKEILDALEGLPDEAEVNVVVTGTAKEDGKYTTFNNLKAELWLMPVIVHPDIENELSAKQNQEGEAIIALVGIH